VSHDRSHIHDDARLDEFGDERHGALTTGVGDRNLHVYVLAPTGNDLRLTAHLREVVCEHLQRNGMFSDVLQQFSGEPLIVGDTGLAHERRIRGEALYQWVLRHLQDACNLCPIGIHVDL